MPNQPATPNRTIRVPDEVWDAAMARAQEQGELISDVIRRCLIGYAGLPPETPGVVGRADGR